MQRSLPRRVFFVAMEIVDPEDNYSGESDPGDLHNPNPARVGRLL